MWLELVIPILGIMVVLVPVTGLTAVLALRWGAKPFVEVLARELRGSDVASSEDLSLRVAELTEQVETLTAEVRRLGDARSFDERLLAGRDEVG